jgi:magnesium chelatase subunit D
MRRRLDFESRPLDFIAVYDGETQALKQKIQDAHVFLPQVEITPAAMRLAAQLAAEAGCAGHRGELALVETARAIAALEKRRTINTDDLKTAAAYTLPHRAREQPPPESVVEEEEQQEQQEQEQQKNEEDTGERENETEAERQETEPEKSEEGQSSAENFSAQDDDVQESAELWTLPRWQEAQTAEKANLGSGRRNLVRSKNRQGRYVRYRMAPDGKATDLAFDATLRAAAPYQRFRPKDGRAIAIETDDFRQKIREKRSGSVILFAVDASASMGANKRMKEVKAAILSMLTFSYQKRDRVGLIVFRKEKAELLLGITRSVELAQKKLECLPTGGKTPLAAGLNLAYEVLMGLKLRESELVPTLVLVSDGKANSGSGGGKNSFGEALAAAGRIGSQKVQTIILDTETGFIRFGQCAKLNEKLHGILLTMEELKAEGIVQAVRAQQKRSRT